MTGDVGIEVDLGQRRHPALVVGTERDRVRAARPRLRFERFDESPADAAPAAVAPHDQRMQLPHSSVIFGQAADPAEHDVVLDRRAGEAFADQEIDLLARRGQRRPSNPRIKLFDEQLRGSVQHRSIEIDDFHTH